MDTVIKRRQNAKQIIIDSAKRAFATKGFDGASVDEIAKGAKVPKSLIYYHFKSKNDILKHLFKTMLDDYKALVSRSLNGLNEDKFENAYMRYLDENKDLVRILLIESLKESSEKPLVFKVVETLMQFENPNDVDSKRMVAEFFTNIIPAMLFTCFKDSWSTHFQVDKERLTEDFSEVHEITHSAYHKTL